jgi:hypothetical protein
MLPSLLLGTTLLVFGVVCNAAVAAVTVRALAALFRRGHVGGQFWKSVTILIVVALFAAALHAVQIAVWALALKACGDKDNFEAAFYHSAARYTTLGTGGEELSRDWRLLGPLEALGGILSLGVSAALTFTVMQRLFERRIQQDSTGRGKSP